ncbi:MAG: type 4a pilus biogenesis protein PilO [Candidatus Chisholmbacteria bacterium]|nr:type 4a pilus biogenesis protein PilO [Candidatus Chisholmbacteria bacterium]
MAFDYRSEYQRYRQYYTNLRRFYQRPVARVSIFVVVSFMTVSFFSLFAIKPTLVTISQLVREIEDKREANQLLEQKLEDLQRIADEFEQWGQVGELAEVAIPSNPEVAKWLLELEVVAIQNQVGLISLQMEPVVLKGKSTEGSDRVGFNLIVGGDLAQVKGFIGAMENLDRLIKVESITFSAGTPFLKQGGVEVTAGIEGEAYFMPSEEENAG